MFKVLGIYNFGHELNGPIPEVQHRKWGPYSLDKYTGQVSGFKHLHFKYQNHKVN